MEDVPHEEARNRDAQDQKEREIIGDQGDVPELRNRHPPQKEKRHRQNERRIGQIEGRNADFEEAVQGRQAVDRAGERAR